MILPRAVIKFGLKKEIFAGNKTTLDLLSDTFSHSGFIIVFVLVGSINAPKSLLEGKRG